jgi:5-methylcytosine-specific restriction endonuclease McrA
MKTKRSSIKLPVLELNRAWNPISIVPVRRAMLKVGKGRALILDARDPSYPTYTLDQWVCLDPSDDEDFIQTAHARIRVPEIIILTEYDKTDLREVKLSRRNLLIRDGYTCQYTGKPLNMKTATIDHVIPQSKGGATSWDNLVICSSEANAKKADKTLSESGYKLAKKPAKPKWSPIYARFAHLASSTVPETWKHFIKVDWKNLFE